MPPFAPEVPLLVSEAPPAAAGSSGKEWRNNLAAAAPAKATAVKSKTVTTASLTMHRRRIRRIARGTLITKYPCAGAFRRDVSRGDAPPA